MIFLGSIVNFGAIFVMAIIGSLLKKGIPDKIVKAIILVIGLFNVYIAFDGMFLGKGIINALIIIISLLFGTIIGELIDIDKAMNKLGEFAQKKFSKSEDKNNNFAQSFVSTTLLFCVGAMAITGAMQGAQGEHTILYAKSVLDGVNALIFASALGIGCILSAFTTFIYQGLITLIFSFILSSVDASNLLFSSIVNHMGCTGSLLILVIGLNLMNITNIKTANLIPAMFMPIAIVPLFNLLGIL